MERAAGTDAVQWTDKQEPRPGVVIAIRRGRRGKMQVVIEGCEPVEVSRETLGAFPLREGEILAGADLQRFLDEDTRQEARARALRFLETRERSSAEVRLRLRRYGYTDELIESTLAYLSDLGYVDDRRFASAYTREKLRVGWGPRRIRAELGRKGVDRPLIAEVLAESTEPAGAASSAFSGSPYDFAADSSTGEPDLAALVERKFGRELQADRLRAERRAAAFLARRGHDWERIDKVLREMRSRVPPDEV